MKKKVFIYVLAIASLAAILFIRGEFGEISETPEKLEQFSQHP